LFVLPAVTVFAVAAVFYGGHRIRSTLEPVVVLCAAVALVVAWDAVRVWRGAGVQTAGAAREPGEVASGQ
jgi:hypothetical protein